MSGEITVLERADDEFRVVFYYPIPLAARKTYGNPAQPVVVTPSSQLPTIAQYVFSGDEKAALDAGEAMFYEATVPVNATDSEADVLARMRSYYTANLQRYRDIYNERYEYMGRRFDST